MAYCTECGHPNRPASRFCRACGAQMELLEEIITLPQPAGQEPAERPAHEQPASGEDWTTRAGRSLLPGETAEFETSADSTADSLAPGTLVAGRYRIRSLEKTPGGGLLVEAEDALTCWSCLSLQPQSGLRYCETCGAELSRCPRVVLVETGAGGSPPAGGGRMALHQGRLFRVDPAQGDALPVLPGVLRFTAGWLSDSGMIRKINEDSLVAYQLTALSESQPAPQIQFFAIADGIGGSDAGEVASRAALGALVEELHRRVVQPLISGERLLVESLGEHLREMVRCANCAILEMRQERGQDMGCTLTAALFYGADGIVANVGDSRAYLFRAGKLTQVSVDHSVVANLVAGGIIRPEDAYQHEQRNVILRSLGDKTELEVDLFPVYAQPGDRFLLCSDGLWEMMRDNVIEDVLLETRDAQSACLRLVQSANQSGGEDNISVILVDVHAQ